MPQHEIDLAATIDHTLLKPQATRSQIRQLCEEANKAGFHSVCVSPVFVALAADSLKDSHVRVCTVIGFPSGVVAPQVKAFEAGIAVEQGADELDMVINVGALKAGDEDFVQADIAGVVGVAAGRIVKVILEACLLNNDEKARACQLSVAAGADYVKTSTGFSSGGASIEDVRLMRSSVGPEVGVKASGGIRDYATAMGMLEAGATRLGTSSGLVILSVTRGQSC